MLKILTLGYEKFKKQDFLFKYLSLNHLCCAKILTLGYEKFKKQAFYFSYLSLNRIFASLKNIQTWEVSSEQ